MQPHAAHRLRPPILQGLALALVLFVGGCDGSPTPTIPGGAEEGDVVAIGGKTIGRSPDVAKGIGPVHRVNAWASEAGIAATRPAVCCSRSASAVGTGDSVAKQLGLF